MVPNFRWENRSPAKFTWIRWMGTSSSDEGRFYNISPPQKRLYEMYLKGRRSWKGRSWPPAKPSDNYLLITVPWFSLFHCNNSQQFAAIIIPIFSILQTNSGSWTQLHLGLETEEELLKSQFLPGNQTRREDTSLKYSPTKPSIKKKKKIKQKHWTFRKPSPQVWASAWEVKHCQYFLPKPAAPFSIFLPRWSTRGNQSPTRWCPSASLSRRIIILRKFMKLSLCPTFQFSLEISLGELIPSP